MKSLRPAIVMVRLRWSRWQAPVSSAVDEIVREGAQQMLPAAVAGRGGRL